MENDILDTPNIETFVPLSGQLEVIKAIRSFNYGTGVLEVLLSGSYGSAKSIVMAHIGLTHLVLNSKSVLCLCRKAMPDLKDTIFKKILDHMEGVFIEGHHYEKQANKAAIQFWNGSEIISRSWHDKGYRKFRSIELSAALVEELTENNPQEFLSFYKELLPRVGRIPSVKENFILCATNPDAPSHPAYEHFIASSNKNRKVFYSRTDQNPYLPKTYIEQIKASLTAQEIRRYVYGEWIEIKSEVIYYAYDRDISFTLSNYKINERHPIYLTFDFNIGENKPMSCALAQYIDNKFLFFDEIIIHSARTLDVLEEINSRGYFDYNTTYIVHGDATGKRRDTRSIHSDYELITRFLSQLENRYGAIRFSVDVPMSNPPVRTRHTIVNGQLKNSFGIVSVFIDKEKCPTIDKGLRLTKLKKGGQYIEDDSDEWQHVTTCIGYLICSLIGISNVKTEFKKYKMR